jgi:catechol 2,3-dioxygenase-like lactoylglutathione lyase family enzyme
MKPRITLITIGVDDLERSLAFYRDGLGLEDRRHHRHAVRARRGRVLRSAGRLQAGAVAARQPGARHRPAVAPPSATEFSLAHNVSSAPRWTP